MAAIVALLAITGIPPGTGTGAHGLARHQHAAIGQLVEFPDDLGGTGISHLLSRALPGLQGCTELARATTQGKGNGARENDQQHNQNGGKGEPA
jgi:hypothetical protein